MEDKNATDHVEILQGRTGQKRLTILGVKLNPGISKTNIIAYWLLSFVNWTCINFIFSFITEILSNPSAYNQPTDQVPDLIGRIGMYAEICAIIQGLLMGVIIDTLGRKIPLIFGQIEAAIAIAAIPLFTQVYPWFFICRCLISLGTVIAVNMPFLPDYVDKGSIGLANSYGQVIMSSALIFSSTGLYQISAQISDAH
jgi:MFS family permease